MTKLNEKVDGWTDEEILKDIDTTFRAFDADNSNSIDYDEFKKCIKK